MLVKSRSITAGSLENEESAMFNLTSNSFSGAEASRLLVQFRDFMKHGGILPSCSICLHSDISEEVPPVQSLLKRIGSYDFYYHEGYYYIGYHYLRDSYALLKADACFSVMDVYYKESGFIFKHSEIANPIYIAYRYRVLEFNSMMIHAAAVIYKGESILFCGPSGAGKSTQADLWKEYLDVEILNYDKPCIIRDNQEWYVHGTPWSGKEGIYKNQCVPLKAIVFVEQNRDNQVDRLSGSEAFSLIYLNNYLYPLNETVELTSYAIITGIAKEVPVYRLKCDISKRAVQTLCRELYKNDCVMEET